MKINYTQPHYPALTTPEGPLPADMGAQACWTYYTRAMNARESVGRGPEDQVLYEGELWMDFKPAEIARGVAKQYQLESPSDFLKFFSAVDSACRQFGYPVAPSDVRHPLMIGLTP